MRQLNQQNQSTPPPRTIFRDPVPRLLERIASALERIAAAEERGVRALTNERRERA